MSYNLAQTFYLDPAAVGNAAEIGITSIDLYFESKPKEIDNKSGIEAPGVEVYICPVRYGVPVINELSIIRPQEPTEHGARFVVDNKIARREWGEISTSDSGEAPTTFEFNSPFFAKTGQMYGVVVKFDGDEDFILWKATNGENYVGTTNKFSGTAKFQGNYFTYVSATETQHQPAAAGLGYSNNTLVSGTSDDNAVLQTDTSAPPGITEPDQAYLTSVWKSHPDVDLKMDIYVAIYSDNGVPVTANASYTNVDAKFAALTPTVVSNNVLRIKAPSRSYEFLTFDRYTSNTDDVRFGDYYWQNAPAWPGGTATPLTISISNASPNVTANGSYLLANGNTFNGSNGWNNLYSAAENEYIIIDSGTNVYIRKVISVVSNTVIILDEEIPETNTVAKFYKAPIARLTSKSPAYIFGLEEELAILEESNANSTVRFVNNSILSISIANGGIGYSNSDYVVVGGYENVTGKVTGGYSAVANMVTNSTGGITALYMSNLGCGFVNTSWITGANVVINNSSAQPVPSGTANGADFTYTIGCKLHSELTGGLGTFDNCTFVNMPVNQIKPEITVNNPIGTTYVVKFGTSYYKSTDNSTFSGEVVYGVANAAATESVVKIFKIHPFPNANNPIIPSRSNEYITHFANGDLVNATPYSNTQLTDSCYFAIETSSNNDYTHVHIEPQVIHSHLSKFIINNDYTNEHTNYGNAYAKHVMTKVSFQEDRYAEDLLVYLTAYRPYGTDFKVYARIHNSKDLEAFDDKDWTLLEQIDGIDVYSSQADDTDYIELTYGFGNWPNAEFTQGNTVSTTNGSATITSIGFDANLAANDIVRIYSPLFPNNYVIDVISSVTNSSQIILNNAIANDNVIGDGFKLSKVQYPMQAFKYIMDDNVVRYYNETKGLFSRYDTFQIKVVLLSSDDDIIPKIDDIRAVGVTA